MDRKPSVADHLVLRERERMAALSDHERVREALALDEQAIALLAEEHGIARSEARRWLARERQKGRIRSAAMESLLG